MTDVEVPRWSAFELRVPGTVSGSWVDVGIEAVFARGDEFRTVGGFAAGIDDLRVRFAPPETGRWTYVVTRDGETIARGAITCIAPITCGPVHAVGTAFAHADGTAYAPFGTTLYAWTHQPAELRAETLRTLASAPFNKVRMCVFPKGMIYNTVPPEVFPFIRGADGRWDVHHPVPSYWDALDERLTQLDALGIQADLILFHPYDFGPDGLWGLSTLPMQDALAYLRYAVRRLASHANIWWSLANEFDMLFHRSDDDWRAIAQQVVAEDPTGHLLSCHNWIRLADADLPWITHCSIQSSEIHRVRDWRERWNKPVVIDELGYEGDLVQAWGHLSGFELVHRMWCVLLSGGYATHGETFFRQDEVIWWAKGGRLVGDAVARIRFLRDLVEGFGAPLEPRTRGQLIDPNGIDPSFVAGLNAAFENADPIRRDRMAEWMVVYEASVGTDDVIIRYLGHSRQSTFCFELPDGEFDIELIDIWNMTRRTVARRVDGTVDVPLPGLAGTVVAAVRQSTPTSDL
jgi:hypothetical protein